MAIVKANYVKRGREAKARAKASLRYITHRRDRDGRKTTRPLFGFDGELTKDQVYQMIDAAPPGTIFYRLVVSPAPKREDRFKDLDLSEITLSTMLALEERLNQRVQFVATIHDDHSSNRHIHALVLVHRVRLTRADLQALRHEATAAALFQRQVRDRAIEQRRERSQARPTRSANTACLMSRVAPQVRPLTTAPRTCPGCGHWQAMVRLGDNRYRCPVCGLVVRHAPGIGLEYISHGGEVGFGRSLSP